MVMRYARLRERLSKSVQKRSLAHAGKVNDQPRRGRGSQPDRHPPSPALWYRHLSRFK